MNIQDNKTSLIYFKKIFYNQEDKYKILDNLIKVIMTIYIIIIMIDLKLN